MSMSLTSEPRLGHAIICEPGLVTWPWHNKVAQQRAVSSSAFSDTQARHYTNQHHSSSRKLVFFIWNLFLDCATPTPASVPFVIMTLINIICHCKWLCRFEEQNLVCHCKWCVKIVRNGGCQLAAVLAADPVSAYICRKYDCNINNCLSVPHAGQQHG